MAAQFPFIKTKCKTHRKYTKGKIPAQHVEAVNKMQHTPWKINSKVLAVQTEVFEKSLLIGMPSAEKVKIPSYPEHLKEYHTSELNDEQREEMEEWKTIAKAALQR